MPPRVQNEAPRQRDIGRDCSYGWVGLASGFTGAGCGAPGSGVSVVEQTTVNGFNGFSPGVQRCEGRGGDAVAGLAGGMFGSTDGDHAGKSASGPFPVGAEEEGSVDGNVDTEDPPPMEVHCSVRRGLSVYSLVPSAI